MAECMLPVSVVISVMKQWILLSCCVILRICICKGRERPMNGMTCHVTGGWMCFDQISCQSRWLNSPHLMNSDKWPFLRAGMYTYMYDDV